MSEHQPRYQLSYELPKLVQAYLDGWRHTSGNLIVAGCLIASLGCTIFVHIQEKFKEALDGDHIPSESMRKGLLVVAYLTIIANCSAVITAAMIVDRVNETPIKAAAKADIYPSVYHGRIEPLFAAYVNWKLWHTFRIFSITSFVIGVHSLIFELAMYVFVFEKAIEVKIASILFVVLGSFPLALLVLQTLFGKP